MNVFVVIPAFNEEFTIKEVLSDLKSNGYNNVVVVDDGSSDKTFLMAKTAGVVVLRHIINRGQGAALRTGIEYALEGGADIVVTFDADGQHLTKDISNLIKPIVVGKADVVLGSRFLDNSSNVPFFRRFVLKGGALLFKIFYGVSLSDSHNGLRAFSRRAAEKIVITQDGMEHASEIVEEISRNQLRFVEVPVTIRYTDYSISRGQRLSNAFNILFKMVMKVLVR